MQLINQNYFIKFTLASLFTALNNFEKYYLFMINLNKKISLRHKKTKKPFHLSLSSPNNHKIKFNITDLCYQLFSLHSSQLYSTSTQTSSNHFLYLSQQLSPQGLNISNFPFKIYSGYLQIASTQRQLHYIFVESEISRPDVPLVLWLNGGPGCSSLEGFFQEIGPFNLGNSHFLKYNNQTWSQIAHLLFLESPSSVGYSYNPQEFEFHYSDNTTAYDNYHALKVFFSKFPDLQKNSFWISGESYAGVYSVLLASKIHLKNQNDSSLYINLKGIIIGNAVINVSSVKDFQFEYIFQHNLVPPKLVKQLRKCRSDNNFSTPECSQGLSYFNEITQFINPYNIYDYCSYISKENRKHDMFKRKKSNNTVNDHIPCLQENGLSTYLNKEEVKRSLHIMDNERKWEICVKIYYKLIIEVTNKSFHYHKKGSFEELVELVRAKKYKIVLYSGVNDAVVSYLYTLDSIELYLNFGLVIEQLKLTIEIPWRPYKVGDQQGGFVQKYAENLTVVTINRAGHMVPSDRKAEAFFMFSNIINDLNFD